MWGEICRLSDLKGFNKFYATIHEHLDEYKLIYDSQEPHSVSLPSAVKNKFNVFEKLLILRTIRPDKLIPAILDYIIFQWGKKFVEPPPFDLSKIYTDSTYLTPLIFILSPGSDPFASLNSFAEKMGKTITSISLGQGQGPAAMRVIADG